MQMRFTNFIATIYTNNDLSVYQFTRTTVQLAVLCYLHNLSESFILFFKTKNTGKILH
jgi:hypothetical protein